ncbi:MAG TPA: 50S ribosomal protein L9 [Phaeodactylibacter sp.]|nr:50S ribosomal protein L9 [Phaeodactylibacter sp.]
MKIILLQNIIKVGDKHEIVTVKDGYGRNYLIPKGMAIIANDANRKKLDELKQREAAEEAKRKDFYQELADKIGDNVLKIGAKAGTSGKIFGSVNTVQIAAALKEQLDVDIERRKITIPDEIKELGEYEVQIAFHPEVQKTMKIAVVKD